MSAVIEGGELLGRSDVRGGFHGHDYERLSNDKSAERTRVADFILQRFKSHNWLYPLTLPGAYWYFEAQLARRHERTQFVGLERSATIFTQSLASMAGATTALAVKPMRFGNGGYEYARTPAFPNHMDNTARSHRLLCMSSDTYVLAASGLIESNRKERNKFWRKFCRRNAVWLDFNSGFCEAVDTTIRNLDAVTNGRGHAVPVALTFMYGRDIAGKQIGRLNHIHKLNPKFEPVDYWTYAGKNGTPMMTVCGMLHEQEGNP